MQTVFTNPIRSERHEPWLFGSFVTDSFGMKSMRSGHSGDSFSICSEAEESFRTSSFGHSANIDQYRTFNFGIEPTDSQLVSRLWSPTRRPGAIANVYAGFNNIPAAEMVKAALDYLGLPATTLSSTLGVTRQTLYNWLKGGDIKGGEDVERLQFLYKLALSVKEYNLNGLVFGSQIRTSRLNGITFIERLSGCVSSLTHDHDLIEHFRLLIGQENVRREALDKVKTDNDIDLISGSIS